MRGSETQRLPPISTDLLFRLPGRVGCTFAQSYSACCCFFTFIRIKDQAGRAPPHLLAGVAGQGVAQVGAEGALPHPTLPRQHQDLVLHRQHLLRYLRNSWWDTERERVRDLVGCDSGKIENRLQTINVLL